MAFNFTGGTVGRIILRLLGVTQILAGFLGVFGDCQLVTETWLSRILEAALQA